MADTTNKESEAGYTGKVRVGLESARELEFDVDDVEALRDSLTQAIADAEPMLWVSDVRGSKYGLVTGKVAFLEIEESEIAGTVGF